MLAACKPFQPIRCERSSRRSSAPQWLLLLFALTALLTRADLSRAAEPTLQLRVAWGGGAERIWQGTIQLDQGKITKFTPLGIEADEPGSMWIDRGAVHVRQRSARAYDAVDLAINAPLDAKLIISLSPTDPPLKLELRSLIDGFHTSDLDDQKNRLVVRRTPGDRLRVKLHDPSLVYSPGDKLSFALKPHLLSSQPAATVPIKMELFHGRSDRSIWRKPEVQHAAALNAPGQLTEFNVPQVEGIYDLIIEAPKSPNKGPGFVTQRKIQFIVLAKQAPKSAQASEPNTLLDEIKPGKPWWERVAKLSQLPGGRPGPLQSGSVKDWNHPQLGHLVALDPPQAPAKETWAAYPLEIQQTGQVHFLEVEYPSNVPQQLGISLIEPNAAGDVLPIGLDSGISVSADAANGPPLLKRHRIAIWPRTKNPIVLLTNLSSTNRAAHGRIRILGPKQYGVGGIRLGGSATSRLPRAAGILNRMASLQNRRILAGYLQQPLFPENFSATEATDHTNGRSLDDWVTFYEGATRSFEYLHHVGYNSLVISVISGGSTIYPSELLEPTPRYDTGTYFTTGQDPVRKDVLEMLLRLADREGVKIIPAIDFSAPLPRLEAALRTGQAGAGIRLIGGDGAAWSDHHASQRGRSFYYNPLNDRVQAGMLEVAQELVQRYGHHPSFGGLQIGSSDHSNTLLPGPDWGFDDETIAEFTRDTQIQVPGDGADRHFHRKMFLGGKGRKAWLAWRAVKIHTLMQQFERVLRSAGGERQLFVSTGVMHSSPDIEQLLRPALPARIDVQQVPLAMGIASELYQDNPRIVLLQARSVTANQTAASRAVGSQLNESMLLDKLFAGTTAQGSLFLNRPHRKRLSSFEKASPFGPDRTYVSLVSQLVPVGDESRRRFVHSLTRRDEHVMIDGGWMLPLGQEPATTDLLAAYRNLPTGKFIAVEGSTSSVVMRTLTHQRSTYAYLTNDSPWPTTAQIQVPGAKSTPILMLGSSRKAPEIQNGELKIELRPYDLIAFRLPTPDVQFSKLVLTKPQGIHNKLEERIQTLVARAAAFQEIKPQKVLSNPSFEKPGPQGKVVGWTISGGQGSEALLVTEKPLDGNSSLKLSSQGQVASAISEPFAAPETGRISYSVWLRSEGDGNKPPLRVAIGGKRADGRDYYRFARADKLVKFSKPEWEHIRFQVDDLPLTGLTELQIRFDLMQKGEVWIDKVVVSPLHFSMNERTELSRIIVQARILLNDEKYSDCERILNSYWPQFLEKHIPLPAARVARKEDRMAREPVQKDVPPAQPAAANEPDENWFKRRLPGFLK